MSTVEVVFHLTEGGSQLVPLSRKVFAIALLAVSGGLLWYSIATYKLSGQNRLGDVSARFFPEAMILNGHSRYLAHDLPGAAESYREAIFAGPSFVDAWVGLARTQIADGQLDAARRTLNIISPTLASISTWKWQELLFAYDLHDEPSFEKCYNYILSYLPHRTTDASLLASKFWGGWGEVVPHVVSYNRPVFLSALMDSRQVDAAVALFEVMENEGSLREENDQLRLCDFLISNNRLKEAKAVWRLWRKKDSALIDDGRFERGPLNRAFGWRFKIDPDVLVERGTGSPCRGTPACISISRVPAILIAILLPRSSPLSRKPPTSCVTCRKAAASQPTREYSCRSTDTKRGCRALSVSGRWEILHGRRRRWNLKPPPAVKPLCCMFKGMRVLNWTTRFPAIIGSIQWNS